LNQFGEDVSLANDDFLEYCKQNPNLNDAVEKYGNLVYEYELDGKIEVNGGILKLKN